jgi:D-lactate dehydrogenase (cytochrome)
VRPTTDPALIEGFLTDASNVRGRADGLIRARATAEVADVVRHCAREGIPLTVSAGKTSTTAGPVPFGGWVLALDAMRTITEIGPGHARAEAAIVLGELQGELERAGWLYPPDPTSRHDCALGASIATNASGARSFRYGATREWVRALEVVLPSGEILAVRRGDPIPSGWPVPRWNEPRVKTAAGYSPPRDLLDVFVGQEGTLGIITAAEVATLPLPAAVVGLLCWFPSRAHAVAFMRVARAAVRGDRDGPLSPRCIEYFDAACVDLARERLGSVPAGAGAALYCEQEVVRGEDAHLAAWVEALAAGDALVDDTVITTDDTGRSRILAFRHAVPAGINERMVGYGMPKVGTDLAVPDDALDEMFALYEASPGETVLFGHLGDNHLHLNLLPRTADELAVAKDWYDHLARRAIALGGTVSAEHGIGKTKKRHLAWMVGPEVLAQFRALKTFLDPGWILGRGNVLDPTSDPGSPA